MTSMTSDLPWVSYLLTVTDRHRTDLQVYSVNVAQVHYVLQLSVTLFHSPLVIFPFPFTDVVIVIIQVHLSEHDSQKYLQATHINSHLQ